ncbi:amyloid protein-binding protein 2-like, partial [Hyposmocoma kahamanoa]|uniref:amyloid protein-binding protein 2-like n=1 Tax=Hyposmocoma kahamanoa TaxID=1477025 RepID=UPI000E6D9BEE
AVIEHGSKLSVELATAYLARCDASAHTMDYLIHLGLKLGGFLNEAGWYADAERVLLRVKDLCQSLPQTTYYKRLTLECCHRLLNTQSAYCCFPAASETYKLALELLGIPDDVTGPMPNGPFAFGDRSFYRENEQQTDDTADRLSSLSVSGDESSPSEGQQYLVWRRPVYGADALVVRTCKEISSLFFIRCDYCAAHAWAMRALALLTPHTPPKITIEVLRACGKACVVKRRFTQAGILVRQAVALARRVFGPHHPRYAAALLDYGFYLLNIDSITHSVAVYEVSQTILRSEFEKQGCW